MGDACNRNQFVRDTTSTKTHHHYNSHHSKSNWSFGWEEPVKTKEVLSMPEAKNIDIDVKEIPVNVKPLTQKVSANSYANGDNQNCGNVMTDRPTTKVHAPPGGKSQIMFG